MAETMMSESGDPLLVRADETYRVYATRWYLLTAFSLMSFSQCLFWITFSPITSEASAWLGTGKSTIDLLLNWGPIIFIPMTPVSMWLAQQKDGLRKSIRLAALLELLCVLLRCVVCLFPGTLLSNAQHDGSFRGGMALIHTAQILNAAVGPLVMNTPTQLSQTWFSDAERTTATAVAVLANNFGAAVGFLLAPAMVKAGRGSQAAVPTGIPQLLYVHAALGVAVSLMVLLYFPSQPPTPPSAAAAAMRRQEEARHADADRKTEARSSAPASASASASTSTGQHTDTGLQLLVRTSRAALQQGSFVRLAIAGGVINGVFNGWSGVLSVILRPLQYSDDQAGWIGFACTVAAIAGGLVLGYFADRQLRRRFKRSLLVLLTVCALSFAWWTLSLPSAMWGGDARDERPLPSTMGTLLIATSMAGFCLGGTSPLFYELALELTYPLPEACSAGIMCLFNNAGCLVFLFIPPSAHAAMNVAMTCTVIGAAALVSTVREQYKRSDDENAR